MFAAVVFDLDGTLIDSEAVAFATGMETFARHGADFDEAFFHGLVGVDDAGARAAITARLPEGVAYETVHGEWRRMIRSQFLAEGVPLKPGARAALEALAARGLPLAIATSSQAESAEFKMGRADIAKYFKAVVVRESVVNPKPAPDAYLEAARRLGVDPRLCLAFEDSSLGARAAHDAGMRVIQIPDVVAPEESPDWDIAPDLLSALRRLNLLG